METRPWTDPPDAPHWIAAVSNPYLHGIHAPTVHETTSSFDLPVEGELPADLRGAYVRNGRCSYPVRTFEPTGVLQVDSRARLTLGDLFAVWGQPLSRNRLVGFRTCGGERVRAYVDGRPWRGDLRAIPLRRHAQIVLEIGDYVPPHRTYRFPRGL